MDDHTTKKRCARNEQCLHPLGPDLPATSEYFGKCSKVKSGLLAVCKVCNNAASNAYRKNNPEKRKETCKNHYQKNRERILESQAKYRKTPYRRAYMEAYYHNNRDHITLLRAQRYLKTRDHALQQARLYKRQNPHIVKRLNWTRRAKFRGSFTEAEWLELCEKYGSKCLRCGRSDVRLTVDHIVPISKGGANTLDNVQPLCQSCNSRKRDKVIDYRHQFHTPDASL